MAILEITFLQGQLEQRKQRLQQAITMAPQNRGLASLLREVDLALERMDNGSYGTCDECHEAIEQDRLMANPLCRYCLDHLTQIQRAALQRDLDLAGEVQRNLLPQHNLCAGYWETSYHYAPQGPVSGDYCDLIPGDGQLFFVLGDVSGKGVAASMLMTQLHALFRTLAGLGLSLCQIVAQANRVLCESAMAGQYATLVCGLAKPNGDVEIHNAGHCPVIVVQRGEALHVDSMGFPLGMFPDGDFSAAALTLASGDTLFLYSDGFSESTCPDNEFDNEYGVERATSFIQQQSNRRAPDLIAACLDDLRAFTSSTPQADDLTLLAIQRREQSAL